MGYTTDFEGEIHIDEAVPVEDIKYINNLCDTRRMKRNVDIIKALYPDWSFRCYHENLGTEGEFFVNTHNFGQSDDDSIEDFNCPPLTQPGLWCNWTLLPVIETEGKKAYPITIEWDGGEKFYNYTEWLEYIIANFFPKPTYHPYGVIFWQGEDNYDAGYIVVEDGVIRTFSYEIALDEIMELLHDQRVKKSLKEIYKDPANIEDHDDDDDW